MFNYFYKDYILIERIWQSYDFHKISMNVISKYNINIVIL